MLATSTRDYLNTHTPKSIDGFEKGVVQPNRETEKMVGQYPASWRNKYKGQKVFVSGVGGEAYQQMYAPALAHLGVEVIGYDTRQGIPLRHGETLSDTIDRNENSTIPEGIPALVMCPNNRHMMQTITLLNRGHPVGLEKPVCMADEVDRTKANIEVNGSQVYCTDFNHMMARSLIALAGGVKMPYMDEIETQTTDTGVLDAIKQGKPLVDSPIKSIKARYYQAGGAVGGGLEHRAWLTNLSLGGGVLTDLMTRQFNIAQLLGLRFHTSNEVALSVNDGEHGEYKPVEYKNQAEHEAKVNGIMKDADGRDISFDFGVGKYAAKNELYCEVVFENGQSLRLDWTPPHRVNELTWRDEQGGVLSTLTTKMDPYILILDDMLSHFASKDQFPMYADTQLNSVKWLGQIAHQARKNLPSISKSQSQ